MVVDGTGISATVNRVAGAIRHAAQATGASFDYLLAAAKVESNLNPGEKAATSSASGLFQFVEQTWLSTLKAAGHALGYGRYADAIAQTSSGAYTVPDGKMRATILNLRNDPAANAAMAGAFTQHNSAELRAKLGRPASGGELYIAHFLGSGGAAKLIAQAATAPNTPGANLFPAAAEANRSIFYDRQGHARSVGGVYDELVGRFDKARAGTATLARNTLAVSGSAAANAPARETNEAAAEVVGVDDAFSVISAIPIAHGGSDNESAFHSLFQTGSRRQPISPVVGALWGGSPTAATATPETARPTLTQTASQPLNDSALRRLFQDGRSDISGLFDGTS